VEGNEPREVLFVVLGEVRRGIDLLMLDCQVPRERDKEKGQRRCLGIWKGVVGVFGTHFD